MFWVQTGARQSCTERVIADVEAIQSGGSPENRVSNTSLTEMEEHPDWRRLFALYVHMRGTYAFADV